jgi:outer membrane protein W
MKKIIIILVVIFSFITTTEAQRLHNLYGLSWEVAFPTGDFLKEVSLFGGKFEYRHFLKPNMSIGGTIGWNNYEAYVARQTYENQDQTTAITTDNQRFIFNLPMTIDGFYYFGEGNMFQPYIGLGLGAQYSSQEVYYNIYVTEDKNWGFIARPQIGTLIKFNATSPTRMMLGAGYNYSTNKNESFRIDNLQNFWVSIGISFTN